MLKITALAGYMTTITLLTALACIGATQSVNPSAVLGYLLTAAIVNMVCYVYGLDINNKRK